jgi:CTP:molybdopterin cytidylyltransferase MocA
MTLGRLRGWGAVILAAGDSVRMGVPKALLPWGRTTLLDHAFAQAQAAGVAQVVVVLGPATKHLEQQLTSARIVYNPEPASGRSASIRLGCAALLEDVTAILVQSVDQPTSAAVLIQLFRAISDNVDLALPTYAGRRGHPVVFAGRLLPELRTVSEQAQGLRSVVRGHAHKLSEVGVGDESVLWNLNDPSAYAVAQASMIRP